MGPDSFICVHSGGVGRRILPLLIRPLPAAAATLFSRATRWSAGIQFYSANWFNGENPAAAAVVAMAVL